MQHTPDSYLRRTLFGISANAVIQTLRTTASSLARVLRDQAETDSVRIALAVILVGFALIQMDPANANMNDATAIIGG